MSVNLGPNQPNKNNYYDAAQSYVAENPFTKEKQIFYAEDWRDGWRKEGVLVGDKLPVIRVFNPKNGAQFALLRPFYLVKHEGAGPTTEKTIAFASPLLKQPQNLLIQGKLFNLVPVYSQQINKGQ
jgi:hypothetical protein